MKLGDVADVIHGKCQKEVISEHGQYPIYGSGGNIMGYANEYICEAGTTILGRKGSINNPQFISSRFWNVDTAFGISAKSGYNNKFIFYFIKNIDWSKKNTGTTLPSLTQQVVKSTPIPVPSLPEQQRIVSYLDTQFAKIDQLKENAEKASLEARLLLENSISKLTKPQNNWESKELKDLCTICGEYGLNESATGYNGIRYIRITDITADGELNEEKVSATNKGDKRQEKLKEGDILFARTGATVGKTLVYKDDLGDCVFAGYLIRYRTNPNIILPKYLFYYTHSSDYYEWVKQNQAAAAQPNISAQKYNKLIINFPPDINEQQEIINKLDKFYNKCKQLENINTQILFLCNDLKQSLLKDIFE